MSDYDDSSACLLLGNPVSVGYARRRFERDAGEAKKLITVDVWWKIERVRVLRWYLLQGEDDPLQNCSLV